MEIRGLCLSSFVPWPMTPKWTYMRVHSIVSCMKLTSPLSIDHTSQSVALLLLPACAWPRVSALIVLCSVKFNVESWAACEYLSYTTYQTLALEVWSQPAGYYLPEKKRQRDKCAISSTSTIMQHRPVNNHAASTVL